MGIFDTLGGLAQRANYALNPDDYRADKELESRIATNEARQRYYTAQEAKAGRPAAPTPTKQPSLAELQNFKDTYGDDPELGPLIDQAIQDALGGQAAALAPVQRPTSGAGAPRAAPRSPSPSPAPVQNRGGLWQGYGSRPGAPPADVALSGAGAQSPTGGDVLDRSGELSQARDFLQGRQSQSNVPSIQAGTASSLPTVTGEPDDPAYSQLKVGDRYVWNGKVFTKRSN
jgi:hypothetical protein